MNAEAKVKNGRRFGLVLAIVAGPLVSGSLLVGTAAVPPRAEAQDQRFERARSVARARLQHLVDTRDTPGISGAVAVNGRVVWADGFGFANLEHEVPATAATRFGLGSLTKTLTGPGC